MSSYEELVTLERNLYRYVADNLGSGCEAQTSTAFSIMEICQEAPAPQKSTKLKELMKDDLKKKAEDILEMLTRKGRRQGCCWMSSRAARHHLLKQFVAAQFSTPPVWCNTYPCAHLSSRYNRRPISSVFVSLSGTELKTKAASAEKFQELEVAAEEKERMIKNLLQALEKAEMKIRQKDSDLAYF